MVAQGVLTPSKNRQNCTEALKKTNKTLIPGPFLMTIILGELDIYFGALLVILGELQQMLYAVALRLIVLCSYVVFSPRNHGKDNLVSPAERQVLKRCFF